MEPLLSKIQTALQPIRRLPSRWRSSLALVLGILVTVAAFQNGRLHSDGRSERDSLLSGRQFSDRELTSVEAAFATAGLANYTIEDHRVSIPRRERHLYMKALVDAEAIPEGLDDFLAEATAKSNPFELQKQREQRLQMAKQQELANLIRSMRGIDEAQVHCDEVVEPGLQRTKQHTAMVAVRPSPGEILSPQRLESIRQMVAASTAGLSPRDVTVADLDSGLAYSGGSEGAAAAATEHHAHLKAVYENEWTQKIRRAVRFIPDVEVVANVELTRLDHTLANPSTAPVPHGLGDGWVPRHVAVSVGVPSDYYDRLWRQEAPNRSLNQQHPSTEELLLLEQRTTKTVQDAVQSILPIVNGNRAASLVQVATFPSLQTAPSVDVGEQRVRTFVAQYGVWLVVICLIGLGGLLLFDLFAREESRVPPNRPTRSAELSPWGAESTGGSIHKTTLAAEPEFNVALADWPSEQPASDELDTEDFQDWVRQHPTAAAEAIRDWLGKAG